jgi:hypothetical protein
MNTLNRYLDEMATIRHEINHNDFGLIRDTDARPELHGFEVDLTGNVVVPELGPATPFSVHLETYRLAR